MRRLMLVAFIFLGTFPGIHAQSILKGTILEKDQQNPVEGVHIFLPELQKGTITDVDGHFQLKNLPDGSFKIQFSHLGYKNIIRNISFGRDSVKNIEITLESTVIASEAVVVSAGNYSTQHDNAIQIEALKSRDMEQLSAPSLMGKLASIPGVHMIAKGSGVTKPVIRGLSNSNILVLNNGVRLENFQFSENHPFMVDEFGVDRVEVIKGPASLLYGSDAVGGIINVIREKPASGGNLEVDLTQKYHSNTRGYVSNLGVKATHDDFFWGARGGLKSHADYISGAGDIVPNTRFLNRSVHTFLGMNKPIGSFRIYYDYYDKNLGMSVPGLDTLVNEQDRNNEMWYQDLSNHMLLSKNTLYLDPLKIEADLSFQSNHRQLVTMNQTPVDMRLNTLGYTLRGRYEFRQYSDLILGVQGTVKNNENFDAPNHVLPDHKVNDLGIFGLLQYDLNRSLTAQAGARWDYSSLSIPGQPESGRPDANLLEELQRNYSNFSASLGATYHLSETVLLRTNLASGFRTPNVAELTQQGLHGNRFEQGNRDLESQTNYEGDLSFHYHCCHAMLDISGFYNYINNYIYLAPTGEITSNGFDIYRYQQNTATLYGGEVQFKIRPVKWFDASLTYSSTIGKQTNGEYLPFIPQNKLRSSIGLKGQDWGFLNSPSFKVETTYAFEQDHPSRFESPTDGYFLMGFNMGTKLDVASREVHLSLTVDNIFDAKYTDHLSTLKSLNYSNMGRNVIFRIRLPLGISL